MIEDVFENVMVQANNTNTTIIEEMMSVNGDNESEKQMLSTNLIMGLAGAAIMLSMFLCSLTALMLRINLRKKMDKKRELINSRKVSIVSESGGFEDIPVFPVWPPVHQNMRSKISFVKTLRNLSVF